MLTPEAVPPGKNVFLRHQLSGWTASLTSISILRNVRAQKLLHGIRFAYLGRRDEESKEPWMKKTIGSCNR